MTVLKRLSLEPIVEQLCTRDANAAGRHAMQLHRLALLRLVPDNHLIRLNVDDSFVRQVVPARDRHRNRNTESPGGLHVIDLVGNEIDERRDDDGVGRYR